MSEWLTPTDPYQHCLEKCKHNVSEGVLIAELENGDGPYRPLGHGLKAALAHSRNRLVKENTHVD